MLEQIIWLYGIKRNYEIGKETALAGVCGLLGAFFTVAYWESLFAPMFNALGITTVLINAGIIQEANLFSSVLNLIGCIIFICLAIGITMAIPSKIILILLSIGGASNKPNPITYAFGILLLPFFLIVLLFQKVLTIMGIISNNPTSLKEYTASSKELRAIHTNHSTHENHLHLLAKQEGNTVTTLTQEKARLMLNKAYGFLSDAKDDYIFGYSREKNIWCVLLPTPIPVYASELLQEKQIETSPLNYAHVHKRYKESLNHEETTLPLFVPAITLNIAYSITIHKLTIQSSQAYAHVVCVDDLELYAVEGSLKADLFYLQVVKNSQLSKLVDKAHVFSYLIPLANHPLEKDLFKNKSKDSYYMALEQVPGAAKYAPYYKEDVIKEVRERAIKGSQWAIELMNQMN